MERTCQMDVEWTLYGERSSNTAGNRMVGRFRIGLQLAPMTRIQDLLYDGTKLFCPDHPNGPLKTGTTLSDTGSFSRVCMAATGVQSADGTQPTCMKSAQWKSEDAMNAELESLRQVSN
jgi:hypothetical protein